MKKKVKYFLQSSSKSARLILQKYIQCNGHRNSRSAKKTLLSLGKNTFLIEARRFKHVFLVF